MTTMKSFVLLMAIMIVSVFTGYTVSGVTAADWRAGNIIDDTAFTDSSSMSVDSIQSFLDNIVPACDTYGQGTLGGGYWAPDYNNDGRVTRREYAQYRGYGDSYVFTCLNQYYEVPKTSSGNYLPANNFGGKPIPYGAQSAAQLIYNAAVRYSISPKVLLVKLATESAGPLTSDDWPFEKQYVYAMGSHCPDTPTGHVCDPNWGGFSLQIDEAAALMRSYLDNMQESWWPYKKPYQTNNILWQDVNVSDCGTGPVYIETKATAALYTYTPYQPRPAVLEYMYGAVPDWHWDSQCATYGNRNFWRTFSDWFGIGGYGNTEIVISSPITSAGRILVKGQSTNVSYAVTNKGKKNVDTGVLWICGYQNNKPYGFGSGRKVLAPGESLIISGSFTPTENGQFTAIACGNTPYGPGWVAGYPYSTKTSDRTFTKTISSTGIIISGAIGSSDSAPKMGVSTNLSYAVRNDSGGSVDTGTLWICGSLNGKAFSKGANRKVLSPGEQLLIQGVYVPDNKGTLTLSACGNPPGGPGWVADYPTREYYDHGYREYSVASTPIVISMAMYANPSMLAGVSSDIGYAVRNQSTVSVDTGTLWICGSLNGKSFALAANRKTLAPNETLWVHGEYTPAESGIVTLTACGNPPGGPGWVAGYPTRMYFDHGYREFSVGKSPIIISAAVYASSPLTVGLPSRLVYAVKNTSDRNVDSGVLWICTYLNGKGMGLAANRKILAPGEVLWISGDYTPASSGSLSVEACGNPPDGPGWVAGYPLRQWPDHGYRIFTVK